MARIIPSKPPLMRAFDNLIFVFVYGGCVIETSPKKQRQFFFHDTNQLHRHLLLQKAKYELQAAPSEKRI